MPIDPNQIFMDTRLRPDVCIYCGGEPETKEHIPPKVFLDLPHPESLPTVRACQSCNNQKSSDEEYLACLLECIACGTTDIALLKRDKVRKALLHAPNLQAKLENAKKSTAQGLIWDVEHDRINSLAIRLAQGHIAYEEFAIWDEPTCIYVNPLHTLPPEMEPLFSEHAGLGEFAGYPELGSRAFLRLFDDVNLPKLVPPEGRDFLG